VGKRRVIVLCAGIPWHHNDLTMKHLAPLLATRMPVVWVDPPSSVVSRRRASAAEADNSSLEWVGANLFRMTSHCPPGMTRPGVRTVSAASVRLGIRAALLRLNALPEIIVVQYLQDLFDAAPRALKVFYGTDHFVAGSTLMGISPRFLERQERRQVAAADRVIAVSPALVRRWAAMGADPVLIPGGCDFAHFARTDETDKSPGLTLEGPVAGLVGQLNARIDLGLLERVADSGLGLMIIGQKRASLDSGRFDRIAGRPNVQWLGPRDFDALPGLFRWMDVGLTPYVSSEFNDASFPLKSLEYLAAGRPVVSTDLPASRWLGEDAVDIASDASEFVEKTLSRAHEVRTPEKVARRREVATRHSWERRAEDVAKVIGL